MDFLRGLKMKDLYEITFTWGIDNVLDVRPDLTYDEAYQVLLSIQDNFNRDEGICNTSVLDTSYELFPEDRQRELQKFRVRVGRRDVKQCMVEMEAYTENEATKLVEDMISRGEFHNKTFTTTAITNEFIYDVEQL